MFLRPERVCLLVCRLSSTLAPSRNAVVSPSDSHGRTFFFVFPSAFRPPPLPRPPYANAASAVLRSAFPAESMPSSSSSRSTPCVAVGFPRTPCSSPLYQETLRAQQPRRKETDRSLSSDLSLGLERERKRDRKSACEREREKGKERDKDRLKGRREKERTRRGRKSQRRGEMKRREAREEQGDREENGVSNGDRKSVV